MLKEKQTIQGFEKVTYERYKVVEKRYWLQVEQLEEKQKKLLQVEQQQKKKKFKIN